MSESLLQRFERLVEEGARLTPLGGFDFSGYNARLQEKYLAWRKACLESLELVGPIGVPYKNKIVGDTSGAYFYQASAHLIFSSVRELFEKVKASPELAAEPVPLETAPAAPPPIPPQTSTGTRTLKPPPKPGSAAPPAPAHVASPPVSAAASPGKVYVIGEGTDPLRQQLAIFLNEIGIAEIPIERNHVEMIALDTIADNPGASFAFFVFNSDDLTYAMFELGHFVGKLGKNHVIVLHMTDVEVPKNIPGVLVKPIVVKLEEASLSIMRELKTAGYVLSL